MVNQGQQERNTMEQSGGLAKWPTETVYIKVKDGQEERRNLESQGGNE